MARALVVDGYAVAITGSSDSPAMRSAAASLVALAGTDDRIWAITAEAGDESAAHSVVAGVIKRWGRLDALVNNAGRGMRLVSETFTTDPVPFWDVPVGAWKSIIDTNVNGPFVWSRAAAGVMLTQAHGRIVNVSTSPGTMVRRGYSPYGPSKAALEGMTRAWAEDLSGTGVTVNLLLPGGATDTDLLPSGPGRRGADGNLLDPAIMGPPAVWLCSAESDGVTGERFIARLWDPSLALAARITKARSAHVVGT
jgi:NAD(P)-dependent dehydrogenase (short-subunit alcohol dehydrogenase family)